MEFTYKKAIIHQVIDGIPEDTEVLLPDIEVEPIGRWGQQHMQYIREYQPKLYQKLLNTNRLYAYLLDIDHEAHEMLEQLIADMKKQEGITEQLKAADQMGWVRAMNNIRSRAEEIICQELIYS